MRRWAIRALPIILLLAASVCVFGQDKGGGKTDTQGPQAKADNNTNTNKKTSPDPPKGDAKKPQQLAQNKKEEKEEEKEKNPDDEEDTEEPPQYPFEDHELAEGWKGMFEHPLGKLISKNGVEIDGDALKVATRKQETNGQDDPWATKGGGAFQMTNQFQKWAAKLAGMDAPTSAEFQDPVTQELLWNAAARDIISRAGGNTADQVIRNFGNEYNGGGTAGYASSLLSKYNRIANGK